MLGQPIYMLLPEVVGFELIGSLEPGVTATDMTLRIVEMLREHGCVAKFVEFHGQGLSNLSLPDRATIANMAPEYGATCGFFPVDQTTLDYMLLSGREPSHVENVKRFMEAQGRLYRESTPTPKFTSNLSLDLSTVEPSLSGPKRPQDRVSLSEMKSHWRKSLNAPTGHQGHGIDSSRNDAISPIDGRDCDLKHGDVVIAAITLSLIHI